MGNFRWSPIFYKFSLIILWALLSQHLAAKTPAKIILKADTSARWFLSGYLPLGVEARWSSGRVRRTTGFMNGNLLWDKLIVTSTAGKCKDGLFQFDADAQMRSGVPLSIQVAWAADTSIKTTLILPMPRPVELEIVLRPEIRVISSAAFSPDLLITYSNGYIYRASPWRKDVYVNPGEVTLYNGKDTLEDGIVRVAGDRRVLSRGIHLYAVLHDYPSVFAERLLYPEYENQYQLDFSTSAPPKARNGHHGSGGGAGQKGEDGQSGASASGAEVYIRLDEKEEMLYLTCLQGSAKKEVILRAGLDQVELILTGMDGGEGGDGGEGDDAADGSGNSGGHGGDGGNGGRGGDGSSVKIYCQQEAEQYLPSVVINNLGGKGGSGGKGGRGGISDDGDGSTSIFDLLFPYRNESGYGGYAGEDGRDGGEASVYIVTKETIDEILKEK